MQAKTSRLVGAAPGRARRLHACSGMPVCRSLGYVDASDLRRLRFRTTPGMSCPGGQRCTSAAALARRLEPALALTASGAEHAPALGLDVVAHDAAGEVVVHVADGLLQRVGRRRPDEAEAGAA